MHLQLSTHDNRVLLTEELVVRTARSSKPDLLPTKHVAPYDYLCLITSPADADMRQATWLCKLTPITELVAPEQHMYTNVGCDQARGSSIHAFRSMP